MADCILMQLGSKKLAIPVSPIRTRGVDHQIAQLGGFVSPRPLTLLPLTSYIAIGNRK